MLKKVKIFVEYDFSEKTTFLILGKDLEEALKALKDRKAVDKYSI